MLQFIELAIIWAFIITASVSSAKGDVCSPVQNRSLLLSSKIVSDSAGGFKIKIVGEPNIQGDLIKKGQTRDARLQKISGETKFDKASPELSYFASFNFGSPGNEIKVAFDLTSDEIWVPQFVDEEISHVNLHFYNGYQPNSSLTSNNTERDHIFVYEEAEFLSDRYMDFVSFPLEKHGPNEQLRLHLEFDSILQVDNAKFCRKPYDGVVGLGFAGDKIGGLIEASAKEASENCSLLMGIWIAYTQYGNEPTGEITLIGLDVDKLVGQIVLHSIDSQDQGRSWGITVEDITFGGCERKKVCTSNCFVSLDTTVNFMFGPQQFVEEIANDLDASYVSQLDLWILDCKRLPYDETFSFVAEGSSYEVGSDTYASSYTNNHGEPVCYLAMRSWHKSNGWLLGTNFLSNFYTVLDFDGKAVAFAQLA